MGARRGLVAGALTLGLAAAGWASFGGGPDVDLEGTWVLVAGRTAAGPLAVTRGNHVTLTFDDGGLGGKGPCNDYGVDYDLDGESFEIRGPGIEQTFAGCDGAPGALESAYLGGLTVVDRVARTGDTLTMTGEEVELELRLDAPWPRADVVDQRWWLVTWTDDAGVAHRPTWNPGSRPFIRFGDSGGVGGRVSGSTGCRVLEGRWREWRGAPEITEAEWSGDCPERLMDQEIVVSSAWSEPVLELRTRDGGPELVVRYAHRTGPGELVYRR